MRVSDAIPRTPPGLRDEWFLLVLLAARFAAGFALAARTFLNPDEAFHYWLSVQPSLRLVYQASLTSAHPPLFIFFLYFWRLLGHSELVLRLPSLLAGIGFAWVSFKWLERVADRKTASLTLILLLFSPSLIVLSAEVRQYAGLLLFMAGSIYFFDRAIAEASHSMMSASGAALLLALLSHYSALLFALAMGIYGLARLYPLRKQGSLVGLWIGIQMVCIAICIYLFLPHIALLREQRMPQDIADTWLRASIFHPGEESLLFFFGRQTLRLFRYLFGQPAVGPVGLVFFVCGVVALIRRKVALAGRPTPLHLSALLVMPLIINLALSSVYPYGGTRHNSFLALFVMPAVCFGLSSLRTASRWTLPTLVIAVLAVSNLSPSPGGPYIRPEDQQKKLMSQTMSFLRSSASPGATIFTDYQGALVLGYYLCNARVVRAEPSPEPFPRFECGSYTVVTTEAYRWAFDAKDFPAQVGQMTAEYHLGPESELWLFQTGWGIMSDRAWPRTLASLGCSQPARFGGDIRVCRIGIGEPASPTR